MKMMDITCIENYASELKEVFTLSDLRVLYRGLSTSGLNKKIEGLIEAGELMRVKRGVYATPRASLSEISSRINPLAYISGNTVLAREAIIGSIPARRVISVKVGRPRTFRTPLGTIEHFSILPKFYFGYELRKGIRTAVPEKAFLDAVYFKYQQGRASIDLVEDVDMSRLDDEKIRDYLVPYSTRFQKYVDNYWGITCRQL